MLSLHQLRRLLHNRAYRRLLERTLANGRHVDASIRRDLLHPAAMIPGALGLALIRWTELARRSDDVGRDLVAALLIRQHDDGHFTSWLPDPARAPELERSATAPSIGTRIALAALAAARPFFATTPLGELIDEALEAGAGPDGARLDDAEAAYVISPSYLTIRAVATSSAPAHALPHLHRLHGGTPDQPEAHAA